MTTRIAVVGAGSVAQRHVEVLQGLDDVRVVSVTDPLAPAADTLARACDGRAFADVDEALDAVPVDAVYVCVPPFAHGLPERSALARGLPLFVEKPVAVDAATAESVLAAVTAAGVVTGTGYHWRCMDVVATAQDLLADSPPALAAGHWLDKRPPVGWWASSAKSGGQVVEQLTHVIDLARLLLGEAVEVYAAGIRCHDDGANNHGADHGSSNGAGDIDDATAATVRFASGAIATLAATSLLSAKRHAGLDIVTRGSTLELSESGLVVDDGVHRTEHRPGEDPKVTVDREFIEAVRGQRESTRAPYREAVLSHRLACAVSESARSGQPVRLDPVPAEPRR
jgi:predicted dehydrogenase